MWVFEVTAWNDLNHTASFLSPYSATNHSPLQVPGQLHGGRSRRLNEGQPSQWYAHHHPTTQVHSSHAHHLPLSQETQACLPTPHGRGRGAGQPASGGGTRRGSVPGVGRVLLPTSFLLFSGAWENILNWGCWNCNLSLHIYMYTYIYNVHTVISLNAMLIHFLHSAAVAVWTRGNVS